MANSLEHGLEQALSELESEHLPESEEETVQPDALEHNNHLHLRRVQQDVRSLKRGQRRMWVAMGLMIFIVAGSVALNLVN